VRSILQDIKVFCFIVLLASPGIGLTEMGHKYALLFWTPLILVIACLWHLRNIADFRRLAPELDNSATNLRLETQAVIKQADEQLQAASGERKEKIEAAIETCTAEYKAIIESTRFRIWSVRAVLFKGISAADRFTESLGRLKAVLDAQPSTNDGSV
jgi:hypothetical protein